MIKRLLIPVILFATAAFPAETSKAPTLEWYKTISGSGVSSAAGVATDRQGNLYIAGSTTSLDLPVVNAAQSHAGGSPLVRINPTSDAVQKLYAPELAAATGFSVAASNPLIIYATSLTSLLRSTDGGNTWKIVPGLPSGAILNSVTVDPTDVNTIYASTLPSGAFKSTDAGATWTAINNGIPVMSTQTIDTYGHAENVNIIDVLQISVDPKSPASLFATTSNGLIRTVDGGASWSVTQAGGASVAFDPFTKGVVYAVSGGLFFKSANEGETWESTALPAQVFAAVIAADPHHKGTLYIGTDSGLDVSTDGGQTWTQQLSGTTTLIVADASTSVVYAYVTGVGIVQSSDQFKTRSTILTQNASPLSLEATGGQLFALAPPSTDVFVVKLDPNGDVVYSTYFGGSAVDVAAGLAIGADGSVYVTGTTASTDFPTTKGAYQTTFPQNAPTSLQNASFVFKLNPNGSLAWSTFFTNGLSFPQSIAIDAAGEPVIGGTTSGGLPVTPGAYESSFTPFNPCQQGSIGICPPPSNSAFLAKFNAQGSALIFSTYVSQTPKKTLIQAAIAMALAPNGNIYFADDGEVLDVIFPGIYLMNTTGTAMLGSTVTQTFTPTSIALDSAGDVYATGGVAGDTFTTTPGAFEASAPSLPNLPGEYGATGSGHAAVIKFDSTVSRVLRATMLGGENSDIGESIAIDASGNVVVAGSTASKAFPARAPFQASFSGQSGFLGALDATLSTLLYSSYLGDSRGFLVQHATPDENGNLLVAGSTEPGAQPFPAFEAIPLPTFVIANKIALPAAPVLRLDSVSNDASQLGVPLSPGETVAALGSGFGSDAKVLLDGNPIQVLSASTNRIVGIVPDTAPTTGAGQVTVSSSGATSNPVTVPLAVSSPGIYSTDGTGYGQGFILNADGSQNSQSNPATPGAKITILATGVGPISQVDGFAVTQQPVAVFVDGFYCNGIAAATKQVPGVPGSVYEISVTIPTAAELVANNPDLKNFQFPPEVAVTLFAGSAQSQPGIGLWIKN